MREVGDKVGTLHRGQSYRAYIGYCMETGFCLRKVGQDNEF